MKSSNFLLGGYRFNDPKHRDTDLLPQEQRGSFVKEDGQVVIDEHGRRI
nr:hypothetical protein [Pseudomonas anatoliensis]